MEGLREEFEQDPDQQPDSSPATQVTHTVVNGDPGELAALGFRETNLN